MAKRCRWSLLVAVWLALAVAGCSLTPSKSTKVSPNWSRGLRVGTASLPQPVAMAVNEAGTRVYLAWSARIEKHTELRYVRLDEQADLVIDEVLPASLFLPREPQLVLDDSGTLHLFCLARSRSDEPEGLFHLPMDQEGRLLAQPTRLSDANGTVTSFWALADREGRVDVLWATEGGPEPGIYHQHLGRWGDEPSAVTLVVPGGEYPTAQVDAEGGMHLAWLQPLRGSKELRYAFFPQGKVEKVEGMTLATLGTGTGTILQRPALGLDDNYVYIFWSAEYRSGLQAGSAAAHWVSFPLGRPDRKRTDQVLLPGDHPGLPLRRVTAPLWKVRIQMTYKMLPDLVELPPEGVRRYSGFIYMPAVVSGQGAELPVAFCMMVKYRVHSYVQPVLTLFKDGQLIGYQMAGRTRHFSLYPRLAADEAGNLHLAWVDQAGLGLYEVYYATTAAKARAQLDRLDSTDILVGIVDTAWGMLSGLALIPLFIPILFVPLIWVVLYYIVGRGDDLRERRAQIVLLVAVVLYLGGRFLLLGPVFNTAPLLRHMPAWLAPAWLWGLPVLLLIPAALALVLYIRRAARPSLFIGFFIFTLTDVLLTLMLYGPGFFGEG